MLFKPRSADDLVADILLSKANFAFSLLALICPLLFQAPSAAFAQNIELLENPIPEGRLAFTSIANKQRDIYVLDFLSESVEPLIASKYNESAPVWSPDGTEVLFHSNMCGSFDVFRLKDDKSVLTRETSYPGDEKYPSWSPNGKSFVFQKKNQGAEQYSIAISKIGETGKPFVVSEPFTDNLFPKWSPRGNEVVFASNSAWPGWDLVLYNFEERKSKRLTDGYRSYSLPSWYPDGGALLFSYGSIKNRTADIWFLRKGDEEPKRITNSPQLEYDSQVVSFAKSILFTSQTPASSGNSGAFQVFSFKFEDSSIQQVTSGDSSIRHLSYTRVPFVPLLPKKPEEETAESLSENLVQEELAKLGKLNTKKEEAPKPPSKPEVDNLIDEKGRISAEALNLVCSEKKLVRLR